MMKFTHKFYKFASLLNDLHAVETGRVPQRIIRRTLYKHALKATGKVSRWLGL